MNKGRARTAGAGQVPIPHNQPSEDREGNREVEESGGDRGERNK
jgi:hypothetical protein